MECAAGNELKIELDLEIEIESITWLNTSFCIIFTTSDTLKCRVPRSALWRRGPLWQILNIVCWFLGDFDFEVLVR